MKTRFKDVSRLFGRGALLSALLACGLLFTGCAKEETPGGLPGGAGEKVLVRLPGVSLADVEVVEVSSGGVGVRSLSAQSARQGAAGADSTQGLLSVTLGAPQPAGGADSVASGSAAPATRAAVQLEDLWVFQFTPDGTTVSCQQVDRLPAGEPLEVELLTGEGYTIGVVWNYSGKLSLEDIPDLAAFEGKLVFTKPVTSFDQCHYYCTLKNVRVLPDGRVQAGGSALNLPLIELRSPFARVNLDLDYEVLDGEFDAVWLYNVPKGAALGPDILSSANPDGTAENFAYTDLTERGLAATTHNGGKYSWYIPHNRRGRVAGITTETDKGGSKAPGYATFLRIKTHCKSNTNLGSLCYDVYLGSNMTDDFNVTANKEYNYQVKIRGTVDEQFALEGKDSRFNYTLDGKPADQDRLRFITGLPLEIPCRGTTLLSKTVGLGGPFRMRVRTDGDNSTLLGEATLSPDKTTSWRLGEAKYDADQTAIFEYEVDGKYIEYARRPWKNGYWITSINASPLELPWENAQASITVEGWLKNVEYTIKTNGTTLVEDVINRDAGITNTTEKINFPNQIKGSTDRTLTVSVRSEYDGLIKEKNFVQYGFYLKNYTNEKISGTKHTYTVTAEYTTSGTYTCRLISPTSNTQTAITDPSGKAKWNFNFDPSFDGADYVFELDAGHGAKERLTVKRKKPVIINYGIVKNKEDCLKNSGYLPSRNEFLLWADKPDARGTTMTTALRGYNYFYASDVDAKDAWFWGVTDGNSTIMPGYGNQILIRCVKIDD